MLCPKCGKDIADGQTSCSSCGENITDASNLGASVFSICIKNRN